MQDKETQSKTIRFDANLIKQIDAMREGTLRNFSQQVQWMLKQYIDIVENTKK